MISCRVCSTGEATITGAAVCQGCREKAGGALMERLDAAVLKAKTAKDRVLWEAEHANAWALVRKAVKEA
jgi:hypothetical protein